MVLRATRWSSARAPLATPSGPASTDAKSHNSGAPSAPSKKARQNPPRSDNDRAHTRGRLRHPRLVQTRSWEIAESLVNRVGTVEKVAVLTFEDGPTDTDAVAVLDVLADRDVPATFYVNDKTSRALTRAGTISSPRLEGHLDAQRMHGGAPLPHSTCTGEAVTRDLLNERLGCLATNLAAELAPPTWLFNRD
ncbi:polysaccharide deacetylase family protein [Rothia halotolerans]|uniref:polysaccharide deacetylase family protein n=1 Tax=Rothia halotolerans TaxID=405770 RepID=UPI003B506914